MKRFDCLKMKEELQAESTKRFQGLTFQERADIIAKRLKNSESPSAYWWRGQDTQTTCPNTSGTVIEKRQ
ncbi:MAG: hypothetical protein ACRC2T_06080 [Thermoguttaceae bacterium]